MTKKLSLLLLSLLLLLPARAVLKEGNIESTLSILRTELTNYRNDLDRQSGDMKDQQNAVQDMLFNVMARSNQNALMLYSQKPEYVFDLAYACHEATKQYEDFKQNLLPVRQLIDQNKSEIARYDNLINTLSSMNVANLGPKARLDKGVCLTLAINIRHTLSDNSKQFTDYIRYYDSIEQQLQAINDYANQCYREIQFSIFNNAGQNYFSLLKQLPENLKESKLAVQSKYFEKTKVRSQWDGRYIVTLFSLIAFYGLIAAAANFLIARYLMPKRLRRPAIIARRKYIVMASSAITLAVILGLIRFFFASQHFIVMASSLLVGYTWLVAVILVSLLLRLGGRQIKSAFYLYAPLMGMSLSVIIFRIVLIPDNLVNLLLPPMLLVFTLWQWLVIRRHTRHVPQSDTLLSYASLLVFGLSLLASWMGYTLLSVQVLIWWMMQLTCILTITCLRGWLKAWGIKHRMREQKITKTWSFSLVYQVVLPVLAIASFLLAIYWAADVFNLSDKIWDIYRHAYINTKWFSASILSVTEVVSIYFLFKYLNHSIKAFLKLHFERSDLSTATSRFTMAKNVVQVAVWGFWTICSLAVFHIDNTWLVVVSGGFSTGVGFAMKDILENIYYGISLMAGRVKVGDYIICDGIRGRVSSISYISTTIEANDGSVISFQNSQLLTKNYKNMTKNHGYEVAVLEVGVAYGNNLKQVRELLQKNILKLPCVDVTRGVTVMVKELADSAVTLKIVAWVPVLTQAIDCSRILECAYDTLNANNIEIPFPQQDIHIVHNETSQN